MIEPFEPSEDSSESEVSTSSEWWVNTPPELLGLPAGSPTQQKKMLAIRETSEIRYVNGTQIHSPSGGKHISYDQAMSWLWETDTSAL